MEEVIITQEEWLAQEQKRMAYWEQQKKECYVEKPLNTYKECWNDVNKWVAFDPHHSNLICENLLAALCGVALTSKM